MKMKPLLIALFMLFSFQKLLGFKEFIKSVEKDRLQEFLKEDQNYLIKYFPMQ